MKYIEKCILEKFILKSKFTLWTLSIFFLCSDFQEQSLVIEMHQTPVIHSGIKSSPGTIELMQAKLPASCKDA